MSGTVNRSVGRSLEILELLSRAARPLGLAELAKELDLPKSSALSLLRALHSHEFVTTDENGRYSLGVRSFEVGSAYLRDMTPARAVEEELRTLTRDLSVTAHFAVLDGAEVVYLVKHDPPGTALQLASSLGVRLPAEVTAVGKAQLAFRPEAASARRGGPAESVLAQVRSNGYAFDEGETAVGIRCVAAPVFDERGCCGAIGVSYLIPTGLDAAEVAQHVMRAGANASARLGGRVWTGAA